MRRGIPRWLAALAVALIAAACRSEDPPAAPAPAPNGGGGSAGAAGGGGPGGQGGAAGLGGEGGGSGGAGARSPLSILSWNLETFPLAPETSARVVEILGDLDPDLVGVEDISDATAFLDLVDSLPGYAAVVNDDPGAFLRLGMLYKTSRVVVSDVQTLFPDSWYEFPRPPLKARIAVAGAEPAFDFVFMVLHLKAQLDAESRERRRAACGALDVWIRDQMNGGQEKDFVLIGDWNDELTDAQADNVFQVFLEDPDTYSFLTLPAAQAGEFSYIPFESMIDHVLVTRDALDEYGDGTTSVLPAEVTYPGYEAEVSDHRPVLSRFMGAP